MGETSPSDNSYADPKPGRICKHPLSMKRLQVHAKRLGPDHERRKAFVKQKIGRRSVHAFSAASCQRTAVCRFTHARQGLPSAAFGARKKTIAQSASQLF